MADRCHRFTCLCSITYEWLNCLAMKRFLLFLTAAIILLTLIALKVGKDI